MIGTQGTPGDDVIIGADDREWTARDIIDGGEGNDTICGLAGFDTLRGGPGDDRLFGGDDSDWFYLGDGNDYIDGGLGEDQIQVFAVDRNTPINANLETGRVTDGRFVFTIAPATIENVVLDCTTGSSDVLIGDSGDNFLSAGSGDDYIEGGPGDDDLWGIDPSAFGELPCYDDDNYRVDDDRIYGGEGDDLINGGWANDLLDGGIGYDILIGSHAACYNGERYKGCDMEDPPPPPPACSDGADNDGDGSTDFPWDDGCESPTNPHEDRIEANCDDGIDNDRDGEIDFPYEQACKALRDQTEMSDEDLCHPCLGVWYVRLSYLKKKDRLLVETSSIFEDGRVCVPNRQVIIERKQPGGEYREFARVRTNLDGRRLIRKAPLRGTYWASILPEERPLWGGEVASCTEVGDRALVRE